MKISSLLIVTVLPICVVATALPQSEPLKFEVASIKPVQPDSSGRGNGGGVCHGVDTKNPTSIALGRCGAPRTTLRQLILLAYPPADRLPTAGNPVTGRSAAPSDVADRARIMPLDQWVTGGPGWIESDLFELNAKAEDPPTATVDQLRRMLQTLLKERFKLEFHMEPKEIAGYFMVPGKDGLKLKEAPDGPPSREALAQKVNAGIKPFAMQKGELTGLAILLTMQMKSPVVNAINIPGVWDFSPLDGADMGTSAGADSAVTGSVFGALDKLGLKLEPHKIPVKIFVIDHAEKPSEANRQ